MAAAVVTVVGVVLIEAGILLGGWHRGRQGGCALLVNVALMAVVRGTLLLRLKFLELFGQVWVRVCGDSQRQLGPARSSRERQVKPRAARRRNEQPKAARST